MTATLKNNGEEKMENKNLWSHAILDFYWELKFTFLVLSVTD